MTGGNHPILVHDTQHTNAEWLKGRKGWAHGTFESALSAAAGAGVKQLVLFLHDPDRSDPALEHIGGACRAVLAGTSPMQISIAQEGRAFEV